ncbi:MAG TPA: DinB family protein [bacterium]|nr:DinB family protein [bacterium]
MRSPAVAVFDVYLDLAASGRVMAHVLEPPGLGVRFASRAEMNRHLPHEIAQHLTWLAHHEEPVPADAVPVFRIAEEASMRGDFESGDDVGFYGPDEVPVTPPEIERHLRIAAYAHGDLLALVAPLDEPALDWVRDECTRPIRRVLRHVVGAELWYMDRIIDDPDRVPLPDIIAEADRRCDATEDQVERLRIIWPAFQQWARSLTADQRGRVTAPTWWTRRPGERWSARKMLRRCIEHSREHTRSIERILADFTAARRGGP